VVAARDAERDMPRLLGALERQTLDRDRYEVLVVDDCSIDATAAIVERHDIATLVRATVPVGQQAAQALALRRARGDVVALTDADCEPAPGWLEYGLRDLEELGVDLLGGHVEIAVDGEPPGLPTLIDLARHLDQERAVNEAGYAVGANLLFRRAVLEDVGPFTEGFRSGADVEWVVRATAAGHRLGYSPAAAVRHPPRATARALARKAFRTGYANGQFRHLALGPLREHGPAWRAPSSYRPMRGVADARRLTAAGYRLSRRRRLALDATHYALVQVPFVLGSAVATIRRGRP
jgi:glycosyltransferase involved in cell wall biosynthesis